MKLINYLKQIKLNATNFNGKELHEKLDDYISNKSKWINSGIMSLFSILVVGREILNFFDIHDETYDKLQIYLIGLVLVFLVSKFFKTIPISIITVLILFISTFMLVIAGSKIVFGHQYSFLCGYLNAFGISLIADSLGKLKYIFCLLMGLVFCFFSYDGKDDIAFFSMTGSLVFYCTFSAADMWYQRILIESTTTYFFRTQNQLQTKKLMEKLFYKPSFMINPQMNSMNFCSLTYNNYFNLEWEELMSQTKIVHNFEIDKILKKNAVLEDLQTLRDYIRIYKEHIVDSKSSIIIIVAVPIQCCLNPDSRNFDAFRDCNVIPFQVKLTSIDVFDESKIFVEFDGKAVEEILSFKEIEKYKENIMSSVSHDVKTPITSSLNYSQQLKSDTNVHIMRCKANIIDQQMHKAHFNISLMMLNAKLMKDDESLSPNISCFGAHRLIRSLCKVLDGEVQGKKISLDIWSDERFTIFNDKESFLYINYILISNAITHTCEGAIKINLSTILARHNNGIRVVEVSIEDGGVGMDQSLVKQIEEADFSRASNKDSIQGGFVGISNVMRMLKRVSPPTSKLKVQSIKGKGSTFIYQVYDRHPAGQYHEKNQRDDIPPEDPSDDDAPSTNLFVLSHIRQNIEPLKENENIEPLKENENKEMIGEKQDIEKNSMSDDLESQNNLNLKTTNQQDKNEIPEKKAESLRCSNFIKALSSEEIIGDEKLKVISKFKKDKLVGNQIKQKYAKKNYLYGLIPKNCRKGVKHKLSAINISKEDYELLSILVIDDCFYNVESLFLILQSFGLQGIHKMVSSSKALEFLMANSQQIDIIFTDYQMPEMNGYELLCEAKKQNLLKKNCRNVLVSAACDVKLENFNQKVFHSFIAKPYKIPQILEEVLEFLLQYKMK